MLKKTLLCRESKITSDTYDTFHKTNVFRNDPLIIIFNLITSKYSQICLTVNQRQITDLS